MTRMMMMMMMTRTMMIVMMMTRMMMIVMMTWHLFFQCYHVGLDLGVLQLITGRHPSKTAPGKNDKINR